MTAKPRKEGKNTITITLTPETETLLRQKAEREGIDVNFVADALLGIALRWEAEEGAAMQEGIRRGLEDVNAGRLRPSQILRLKYAQSIVCRRM